ncbi:UPF0483 protein, partial [Trifolium medium]|nr:UPF0483 protein [Trifolium medium]
DNTEYRNFEECIAYIEDYMLKNGPFDGLLGLSQCQTLMRIQHWNTLNPMSVRAS